MVNGVYRAGITPGKNHSGQRRRPQRQGEEKTSQGQESAEYLSQYSTLKERLLGITEQLGQELSELTRLQSKVSRLRELFEMLKNINELSKAGSNTEISEKIATLNATIKIYNLDTDGLDTINLENLQPTIAKIHEIIEMSSTEINKLEQSIKNNDVTFQNLVSSCISLPTEDYQLTKIDNNIKTLSEIKPDKIVLNKDSVIELLK
jgi:hypothetical protein